MLVPCISRVALNAPPAMTTLGPELQPDAGLRDPIAQPRSPRWRRELPLMKRRFLQLPTFSALMAALDPPLIGECAAENTHGPVVMNGRFENPEHEIAMETVERREFLLDGIIRTLLFRARKGLRRLTLEFRKRKAVDESATRTGSEGSFEEI